MAEAITLFRQNTLLIDVTAFPDSYIQNFIDSALEYFRNAGLPDADLQNLGGDNELKTHVVFIATQIYRMQNNIELLNVKKEPYTDIVNTFILKRYPMQT